MRGARTSLRAGALVIAAAAVVGILVGLGVHRLSSGDASDHSERVMPVRGQAIWPESRRAAPSFALRDSAGQMFRLASMRGQPLILTFMDSRCHQECPLEGRALAAALRSLPRSLRAIVVAVSVNPWEDTPTSARRAIRRFGLDGFRWRWLLGSKAQLSPVWRRYGIEVRRRASDIEHTDALYLIDSSGFERAGMVYPFLPTWVSGDLKTLAAESSS